MNSKEWFEEWFDSPYYPILYHNRDDSEAFMLISRILETLNLSPPCKFLDLACGQGRHTRYLQQNHHSVFGFDISAQRIQEAKQISSPKIQYFVHDMRKTFPVQGFHAVFNLFTSFGYFHSQKENILVLNHIYDSLRTEGWFILDYFNKEFVLKTLIKEEKQIIGNLTFHIKRYLEAGKVIKEIRIQDGKEHFHYCESVQAFGPLEFAEMLSRQGFELIETWGDYQGNNFSPENSPRLILLAQKI